MLDTSYPNGWTNSKDDPFTHWFDCSGFYFFIKYPIEVLKGSEDPLILLYPLIVLERFSCFCTLFHLSQHANIIYRHLLSLISSFVLLICQPLQYVLCLPCGLCYLEFCIFTRSSESDQYAEITIFKILLYVPSLLLSFIFQTLFLLLSPTVPWWSVALDFPLRFPITWFGWYRVFGLFLTHLQLF